MKNLIFNTSIFFVLGLLFLWSFTFVTNKFVFSSFEYNLNHTTYIAHDMCVGSNEQTLTIAREVRPTGGFKATISAELFRYENGKWIETTNKRYAKVVYQDNGGEEFYIEIKWDEPITKPGVYGAGELVDINPVPFVHKTKYFLPQDNVFNVVECEHG